MSSSQTLYTQVFATLRTFHPNIHLKRMANWVWVIVGLIQAQSVHLSEIANHIPGEAQAAGRIMKIRRWLSNKHITTRTLYEPIIQQVLTGWAGREVTIMLDGCFVNGEALQMLRVSLSHCYRALPLAWKVVATAGLVELEVCETMLDHVATLLKRTRRVTFLADRGFRDRDWARKCRTLGWDYIIGIANNTYITFSDGRQIAVDQLGVMPGQRRYFPNVRLTREADWGCNIAITWTRATPKCPAELCVVMTNLHADGWVLRHYLKRMHIEIVFTQMTKGGAFPRRTGWQDVPDLDLAVRDDDTVDEEFDQLSALGEIQVFQGRLDALAERGDSFRQFGDIDLALRLSVQLAQLVCQSVLGLLHLLSFALEFVAADNFGQVAIQQPRLLAAELG
jgi:hypothetical protein